VKVSTDIMSHGLSSDGLLVPFQTAWTTVGEFTKSKVLTSDAFIPEVQ